MQTCIHWGQVISLTTIGLGDVVPKHPKYMLAASALILVGLALVSTCVNLIHNKLDAVSKVPLLVLN